MSSVERLRRRTSSSHFPYPWSSPRAKFHPKNVRKAVRFRQARKTETRYTKGVSGRFEQLTNQSKAGRLRSRTPSKWRSGGPASRSLTYRKETPDVRKTLQLEGRYRRCAACLDAIYRIAFGSSSAGRASGRVRGGRRRVPLSYTDEVGSKSSSEPISPLELVLPLSRLPLVNRRSFCCRSTNSRFKES